MALLEHGFSPPQKKYESGISNCCINLAKRSVWRWAREIIQAGGLFLWFEWVLGTDFGQRSAMNWAESFGGILRDRDGPKACERKNGGHGQVASGHPCHIMLVSNQCRKWDLIWNNIILVWFQHIGSIVFTLVWCQQMMLAFKIKSTDASFTMQALQALLEFRCFLWQHFFHSHHEFLWSVFGGCILHELTCGCFQK